MVEILSNGAGSQSEKESQDKASTLTDMLKITTGKT